MKNRPATLVGLLATALAGPFLSGCSEDGGQFVILRNQAMGDECLIPGDPGAPYVGDGVLDVALVRDQAIVGYVLTPLLRNDLPSVGEPGSPEPNRLALHSFKVTVEPDAAAPDEIHALFDRLATSRLTSFEEPWSGSVDPAGGHAPASTVIVPADLARQIRETRVLERLSHIQLFARVRAVARRQYGTMESSEFRYPVSVCQGCLIRNVRACPFAPVNKGNPCNLAQDGAVDCCLEANGTPVCPSRPPAMGGGAP